MSTHTTFTKSLTAASANNIALSQSPGTAAFTLNGAAVTSGVATIDTANTTTNIAAGRRVIITSAGDNSGINFLVTGTLLSGALVTDTFAGTAPGAAQSNFDFVTVTKVIGSGAVTGAVTVGTNTVGSSPWYTLNYRGDSPINVAFVVELVSGSISYTVQYTQDVPNSASTGQPQVCLPIDSSLAASAATGNGSLLIPCIAVRTTILSGTGVIRTRIVQAGMG